MLPQSSQKVVDYWWPVVKGYAEIQLAKGLTLHNFIVAMEGYMETKTFLVRERREMMLRVLKLAQEQNA